MPHLYDTYKDPDPWDTNLPPDLIPPIKHLRETFDEHHWTHGRVTGKLCYWQLHPTEALDPTESLEEVDQYLALLEQLKRLAGLEATHSFISLLQMKSAPALFKAFFDLYMDSMSYSALAIFHQFVAIGRANEQHIGFPHLEWAKTQTDYMIRGGVHKIRSWVRTVCDTQPYTPEDWDEQLYWKKWQAPMLLIMKPSRYMPYDSERIWERNDEEGSARWLDSFAEHYVINLEAKVKKAAGMAAVELAKQPRPQPSSQTAEQSTPAEVIRKPKMKRTARETQKLATRAKYRSWQQEYKLLRSAQPDRSDVWYSKKIARSAFGKGNSEDTIRKHMKRK